MNYFSELDIKNITNRLVILDIDGTIVADGGEEIDKKMLDKINELKISNRVYIYSNRGNNLRNKKMSDITSVPYINSQYKKPSKKILGGLDNVQNLPRSVIGDKILTDGLFAKNIKAEFIKVKRVASPDDRIFARILYTADDFIYNFMQYLFLLRPFHWVKNLLIFVPIFFAKEFFITDKFLHSLYAFFAFSLVASGMYIFNDIIDKEEDKLHPKKKTRPIAGEKVSIKISLLIMAALLVVSALIVSFLVPQITFVIWGYVLLNLIYSFYLKKIVIFDILAVSGFYLLRILAGGAAIQTPISRWLVLCLIFVSLLIIIGKRRAEFNQVQKRKVLNDYNLSLFDSLFNISAGLTLVSYGLYSVLGTPSSFAVYSIFFVLLGIFRYLYIIYSSKEGAEFPEKIIFSDKIILGSIVGWLIFMFFIFYL